MNEEQFLVYIDRLPEMELISYSQIQALHDHYPAIMAEAPAGEDD
jgi:hypothetical protein